MTFTLMEQCTHHPPLAIDDVRHLLKLCTAAEEALLTSYITLATEEVEHRTQIGLHSRRLQVTQNAPKRARGDNITSLRLPMGPVRDVAVDLVDANTGTVCAVPAPTDYKVVHTGLHATLLYHAPIPRGCSLRATYTGGFATPELIPHGLRHALMLLVASFYKAVTEGDRAVVPHQASSQSLDLVLERYLPPRLRRVMAE